MPACVSTSIDRVKPIKTVKNDEKNHDSVCGAASVRRLSEVSGAVKKEKKEKAIVTAVFVTDVDCAHCVDKILNNVPTLGRGIKDVQVDLQTKEVTVVYDASKNDERTIVEGLASLKVKAEPKAQEAPAPQARR